MEKISFKIDFDVDLELNIFLLILRQFGNRTKINVELNTMHNDTQTLTYSQPHALEINLIANIFEN